MGWRTLPIRNIKLKSLNFSDDALEFTLTSGPASTPYERNIFTQYGDMYESSQNNWNLP